MYYTDVSHIGGPQLLTFFILYSLFHEEKKNTEIPKLLIIRKQLRSIHRNEVVFYVPFPYNNITHIFMLNF